MASRVIETDCLIIGGGIAGMSAAVALTDAGLSATLITAASELHETNTYWAQGGIIYQSQNDSPEKLVKDILEAGSGINHVPAVEQLARLGPGLVKEILIDKIGTRFDKNSQDGLALTREGAHSENRIVHQGDESGKAIELAYVQYFEGKKNVQFLKRTTAVNLLMSSYHSKDHSARHETAHCFGAFVYDQEKEEVYPIFARHTILATGGIGQLFRYNTNSKFARGDGIALAHRAGCRLENLEFIQFHPTTFFHPKARRFLISEALRGEGALLVDGNGQRFLSKYLPSYETPELAPRDKVARAIHQEMLSSSSSCVYLDISHKPADWIKERFPFVYRSCLEFGVDITKQPIPVVPGAHYHCGGVWTDLNGKTTVDNLWAVGEVACTGVHGANRLASTSLLEGLTWGTLAGKAVSEDLRQKGRKPFPLIDPWKNETAQVDPAFLKQDWEVLKQTMWNYVGLIKTEARLNRAEGILSELAQGIDSFYRRAKLSDELIGLRQATLVARLVLEACKRNTKSLGCYLRGEMEI